MRIAWFSPLNVNKSASSSVGAYLTDLLLPELSKNFEIELFHAGYEKYLNYPTYHYLKALERHRENSFDLFFYQIENKKSSDFVRSHIGLMPGVVLFHDFLFTEAGPSVSWNSPWRETVDAFVGGKLISDRKHSAIEGPYALREAALSGVALFTSERDHAEYLRMSNCHISNHPLLGKKPSYHLPFPVGEIKPMKTRTRTICYSGSCRLEHRGHKVLEALSQIEVDYNFIWLIEEGEEQRAKELLDEFEISNAELIGPKSPALWATVVERSDIALHTLFSAYGQLGPYIQISLCAGLACVTTDFGAGDYLSDSLVYKIQPGKGEALELAETLRSLLNEPPPKAALKEYCSQFKIQSVLRELHQVFKNDGAYLSRCMEEWTRFSARERQSLLNDLTRSFEGPEAWEQLGREAFKELGWS